MFGNHGLCGLLEEGAHGKSPKCLGGNLGDFGEFCKGLDLYHKYPKQFQIYRASTYNLEPPPSIPVTFLNSIHVSIMTYLIQIGLSCCNE